ncbi:FecCD family ABC transporter permease [Corynebacterium heidelbergense]|uniref:Sugar ABC transporter substrate-binding protein n=1 Tax=Corynebacterium heidelbergense TaxID=2055947 RepID=A0A364V989_9CORY|nr:iron ABC transporter permease [Corynebacterium heidelbergense]RAV33191.1 sugar ABC transporter substrate-binding protein [Corynebacterium heidelbergense]WCZ36285.1 Hemin transport system permease protein HmuU [Corynebacterium heidelbergense]
MIPIDPSTHPSAPDASASYPRPSHPHPRRPAPGAVPPRVRWAALALLPILAASILAATSLGAAAIPLGEASGYIWAAITGAQLPREQFTDYTVVTSIRLPRALLAALVGAGLGALGVAAQAMVRNPLADPFILGISSGASVGAAAVIALGTLASWGVYGLSIAAFASALGASTIVYLLARTKEGLAPTRLILVGVVLSFGFQGLTSAIVFFEPRGEAARTVMFWLLGSLGGASWSHIPVAVGAVVITVVVLFSRARVLDVLSTGDAASLSMGINPKTVRTQLFVLVALGTGVLVAVSGTIGFVGLVIPHIVRMVVGPAHRAMVVLAPLIGAILLVWVDVFSRSIVPPRELPIGVVTALLGVPIFVLIIRSSRYVYGGSR